MTFADDMRRFVIKVQGRTPALALSVATKVHASIKEGSATTGAPGQPVSTGFLKNSWILEPGKAEHVIRTNVSYAPAIEYNDRAQYDPRGEDNPDLPTGSTTRAIKSTVGGSHSVALTLSGANLLQAEALRELA